MSSCHESKYANKVHQIQAISQNAFGCLLSVLFLGIYRTGNYNRLVVMSSKASLLEKAMWVDKDFFVLIYVV